MFRGCSGLFRAVPGCSGGVPGCSGVFRGVPGFTDTHQYLPSKYGKEQEKARAAKVRSARILCCDFVMENF